MGGRFSGTDEICPILSLTQYGKFVMKKYFILCGFLLYIITGYCQERPVFKLDTVNLYLDRHLDAFLSDIRQGHFVRSDDKNAIPAFILSQLKLLGDGFSIANPNEEYRCCCMSPRNLPARKLLFLSMNKRILVMTYLNGGVVEYTNILFIRCRGEQIVDLWNCHSFLHLSSMKSILSYVRKNRGTMGKIHGDIGL